MISEMNTIEIAKLYESQGYYEDAYQVYLKLDRQNSSSQTRAGINRMEMKIATASESDDAIEGFDFQNLVHDGLVDDNLLVDDNQVDDNQVDDNGGSEPRERIAYLCEKWINLIVLKHRLSRFKKFKTRLI